MERSITAGGLGGKEVLLIKSYLGLLPGKTQETWSYRDAGPADVEIVPSGAAATGDARLRIEYGAGEGSGLRLQSPIRVASVIAALDQASLHLQQAASALVSAPSTSEPPRPVAADGSALAELLRPHPGRPGVLALRGDDISVEVDFERRAYRSSRPLTSADVSHAVWRRVPQITVPYAVQGPLTYLQWLAGVAEARVQPGHYRLRRWPDFGRLPHRPSFVKLAAYFARTGGSPSAAAEAALVPFPDVEAFLAGCMLAGYATRLDEDLAPPSRAPAQPDEGLRGFLGKMRRRLGI